jgi:serine/threonine protein kinase
MDAIQSTNLVSDLYPILDIMTIGDTNVKLLLNFKDIYEKVKTLGLGGFGQVKCYKERATGNLYAFKEIVITARSNIQSLQDEVAILSRLSRVNHSIVKYYDSFVRKNKKELYYVIVTEYIHGFTLQDYINTLNRKNKRPDDLTIFNLTLWLFSTLAFLHDSGYIHRDIKPNNIMIDTVANRFVLLDFGLSYCKNLCTTYSDGGTPEFISPERWEINKDTLKKTKFSKENIAVFKKMDIWSAGLTIYSIMELTTPWYKCKLPEDYKSEIMYCDIPYTYTNDIITNLVKSTLDRDPLKRPTADELVHKMKDTYELFTRLYYINLNGINGLDETTDESLNTTSGESYGEDSQKEEIKVFIERCSEATSPRTWTPNHSPKSKGKSPRTDVTVNTLKRFQ